MNASDIKNFVFSKSAVGGYKVSDVKSCLKEISDYVLTLEEKIFNLDRENKSLRAKLLDVEKTQDEIKEIMISAQDFKHKILKEAEDKTNELVLKAQEKAKAIEQDAERKSSDRVEKAAKKLELKRLQFEELKKKVSAFKVKLMELYKAHIDLITKLPEIVEDKSNSSLATDLNDISREDGFDVSNLSESDDESESEVLEHLQATGKFDDDFKNRVQHNLSGNEKIFQRLSSERSESKSVKSDSKKLQGDSEGYIESRFEELDR